MKKIILCLSVVFLIIAAVSYGKDYRFEYQKEIAVTEKSSLTLSNISGGIEIMGVPGEKVLIRAIKIIQADKASEAEERAGLIEIEVKKTGNLIDVATNSLKESNRPRSFWEKLFGSDFDSYGSVDYTISVPPDCRVEVESVSGDMSISDIKSDIDISSTSGDLSLRTVQGMIEISTVSGDLDMADIRGDIDISSTSSDMRLDSINGMVDIRSTSGDLRGTKINGSISLSQTSGVVRLAGLSGDLRLKSTSGDIVVRQESGAIDIVTYSGDVEIQTKLDSPKDYYVETTSGMIVFAVPQSSSGSIRMETDTGRIITELSLDNKSRSKHRMAGNFGKGGPKISLSTDSGDITLESY